MEKFLIGIFSCLVILLGGYVGFTQWQAGKEGNVIEQYQHSIDSLNVKIDSIRALRSIDKKNLDSLYLVTIDYKGKLNQSKVNYAKINEKYEKINRDLTTYSTDQHIEFFTEQVSEEAGY
jgi:hypothetical protein